jgi:outer membrane lipoprotein-sorting protein
MDRINGFYDQLQTLKSNFEQVKTISILSEDLVATGVFYYQKPGLIKWDQKEPDAYYFLINENEIIRFNGNKRQKLSPSSPRAIIFKDFIMGTVDGSIFNDKRFLSSFSKVDNVIVVELVPKEKSIKKRIGKIILYFDYTTIYLKTLMIEENDGDNTVINFFGQQINTDLDKTTFQ